MKHKISLITYGVFILMIAIVGLYWLALGAFLIYVLFTSIVPKDIWKRRYHHLYFLTVIMAVFLLAISLRVFLFEIFSIPSRSMEDTLIPGDKVLVSKLEFGPALPRSPLEIPWLNLVWYLSLGKKKTDSLCWPYKRLSGFSSVKKGDITVFVHPLWGKRDNYFIKRCVAVAGDTLKIIRGVIYVNNKELSAPYKIKQSYRVNTNNQKQFLVVGKKLGIEARFTPYDSLEIFLNFLQFNQLRLQKCVDSILVNVVKKDSVHWVYSKSKDIRWTIDDLGPLVIPKKGMTIGLTDISYAIYQQTIQKLEKQEINRYNGLFYLDGQVITKYTFHHNYLFLIGDNRHASSDSRYWGVVPEENIIGKGIMVLFSTDFNERGFEMFRWKRFFKFIE